MTKQNQDKEKDVNPVKKLFSYAVLFAVGCALINYGIRLLSAVWLPLLFLGIFVILLTVGWRIRKAQKWRE
ncbi:hypothetical protein I6N96_05070 [Enterococcus sp. BWM-S5]|uniref:Uncharacterized protein n=1 Tax=Enterococcus larvae TaxID=2794352 RepID=A0ABS4CI12_9ENTE|nr:hypothetical protein [Enterococcus larvae]MBP1045640.1 hypothetical protein [Enterococcus larvae]